MARIIFSTCEKWPTISASDSIVASALSNLGHQVEAATWNGPFNKFLDADLVVLRSTWDYHYHIKDFNMWLDRLQTNGVSVQNSVSTVKWNLSKSYITDLALNGIRTPDTVFVQTINDIESAFDKNGWKKAVVKPAHGASGHLVECISREDIPNWQLNVKEHGQHRPWIIQEYLSDIEIAGELSMVFINRIYSHAVLKTPQPGEFRINGQYGGQSRRVEPKKSIIEKARHILETLEEKPLYVRIDGVLQNGEAFCLLELELIEPGLFYNLAPDKANMFAKAIEERL
ncbi:MAG: hypothetical protein AAF502_21495 [Bacteroidota bacterium]